jgi:uncharacterized protein (TIGR02145 family)
MKKLILALALTSALFSCKKETTTPNNSGNNTTDTTKTSNDESISGFDCAGVKISGTLTKDNVASNVSAIINYTGGNGKVYLTKSHTSSGVTGLSATILAGTLANGGGTLIYTISGTPNTAGTASFAIDLGGKSCTINIAVDDVTISGFDCVGVKITGTLVKGKVVSNVSATINYTGGNGKTYLTKSHTSKGVTGLSATLQAGTLANGGGTLIYTISGTPNTAGTASFAIDLGGKSCTINITVDDVTQTIGKPGPNITDSEGNSYKTVYIGTQQWMAENLKVSKFSDGTTIPNITDITQWSNLTSGAWVYYNNDATNNAKYGKLYNWYAVSKTTNDNKNVCPTGWHVPTDAQWTVLTNYLGGQGIAGGKMKEVGTASWNSPNIEATNVSLFTGLPGGQLYGAHDGISKGGYWWSSTEKNADDAWIRYVNYDHGSAGRSNYGKGIGVSVRCLKD